MTNRLEEEIKLFWEYVKRAAAARSRSSKQSGRGIKLYYLPLSPPCRSVMMLARAIGVDLDLVITNVMKGEHLTPEFVKMNPQHTVPTLDDNGFILWESRAIMQYLVNAYAPDDSLYPKNPRDRAVVDQKLNFDQGTLYSRFLALYVPALFHGKELKDEHKEKMNEALGFLDMMLEDVKFLAGDNLTIADFAIAVTISNLDIFGYDISSYDNMMKWYERAKKALAPYGYKEINETGAQMLGNFLNK